MNTQPTPTPEQIEKATEDVISYMENLITVLLLGAKHVLFTVPAEVMLVSTCKALARHIGKQYRGGDDEVRKFREQCRVAFSAQLHQVPVAPIPKAPDAAPKDDGTIDQAKTELRLTDEPVPAAIIDQETSA